MYVFTLQQKLQLTIEGNVVDNTGAVITDAKIKIDGDKFHIEIKPGDDGTFKAKIPPGTYKITVESPGYVTQEQTFSPNPGSAASITFTMISIIPEAELPNNNIFEVSEFTFSSKAELQQILDKQSQKRKKLIGVIPIKDGLGCFILAPSKTSKTQYFVVLAKGKLSTNMLTPYITGSPNKIFVGACYLNNKSHLIIFYNDHGK